MFSRVLNDWGRFENDFHMFSIHNEKIQLAVTKLLDNKSFTSHFVSPLNVMVTSAEFGNANSPFFTYKPTFVPMPPYTQYNPS